MSSYLDLHFSRPLQELGIVAFIGFLNGSKRAVIGTLRGDLDDIMGQTYSTYIITIAGAEFAIGLGILVVYYRLRGA